MTLTSLVGVAPQLQHSCHGNFDPVIDEPVDESLQAPYVEADAKLGRFDATVHVTVVLFMHLSRGGLAVEGHLVN